MKKYLYIGGLVALIGATVAIYLYNKPHPSIAKAKPDLEIEAIELFGDYSENEEEANVSYLDKLILVEGEVVSSNLNEDGHISVTLKSDGLFGVICHLDHFTDHQRLEFAPGETVKFKGICTGMLMDVLLVRCVEVE